VIIVVLVDDDDNDDDVGVLDVEIFVDELIGDVAIVVLDDSTIDVELVGSLDLYGSHHTCTACTRAYGRVISYMQAIKPIFRAY